MTLTPRPAWPTPNKDTVGELKSAEMGVPHRPALKAKSVGAVADKTNEITTVEPILQRLVLEGRIVTIDALLTQRRVAQTIVDKGGDYVMIVKENQPQLRADVELVFTLPPRGDCQATARTVDLGHGRIEQRNLTTSAALVGYSDWLGLAQVCQRHRHVARLKNIYRHLSARQQ